MFIWGKWYLIINQHGWNAVVSKFFQTTILVFYLSSVNSKAVNFSSISLPFFFESCHLKTTISSENSMYQMTSSRICPTSLSNTNINILRLRRQFALQAYDDRIWLPSSYDHQSYCYIINCFYSHQCLLRPFTLFYYKLSWVFMA